MKMSPVGAPDVPVVVGRPVMRGEDQSPRIPPRERRGVFLRPVAVGVLDPVREMSVDQGEMSAFELNTVRIRDADGAEGVGYTYTVGRNGGAIDAVLRREIAEIVRHRSHLLGRRAPPGTR